MKRNLINAVVNACNTEDLVNAIMALTEDNRARFIDLAVGDVDYYTNDTLPKVNTDNLGAYIIKHGDIDGKDLVSIDNIEITKMCTVVEVHYHYNHYEYYFNTEEDANNYNNDNSKLDEIPHRTYRSNDCKFGAGKIRVCDSYVSIYIDEYLAMCD